MAVRLRTKTPGRPVGARSELLARILRSVFFTLRHLERAGQASQTHAATVFFRVARAPLRPARSSRGHIGRGTLPLASLSVVDHRRPGRHHLRVESHAGCIVSVDLPAVHDPDPRDRPQPDHISSSATRLESRRSQSPAGRCARSA